MDVCFFGGYDSGYPRNAVLRRGLAANGVRVSECRVRPGQRFWLRYPLLLLGWLALRRKSGTAPVLLLVPEFCQKDLPLARLLSVLFSRRIIFDPLASRFETKILDWRRRPEGSLAAWWNRAIDRWALRASGLVLADTQTHKEYYCREFGMDAGKIEVLPVGFDDQVFPRSLALRWPAVRPKSAPFTALFFGSFLPLHGAETIVQAARFVSGKDKDIRFKFIGSGQTLPRTKRLAADLGLSNVSFEGWTQQRILAEKVALEADICLGIFGRTKKAERVVPHKIFQAMALRKPVITGRTPAVEEFFSHRADIYLCRNDEPASLAEAVLELKRDKALREAIAARGYQSVWEKYQPRALGAALNDILVRHFLSPRSG